MYTDKFAKAPGELKWSLEILPPELGKTVRDLQSMLEPILEYKPISIDVTYHQEEMAWQTKENGVKVGYPQRKKPGTIPVCAALSLLYKEKFDVELIPHLICGGFSVRECEEALIDCYASDLHTVLALRGDALDPRGGFVPHPEGHKYASQLVEQIVAMNRGNYFYPIQDPFPTDFCIGVAGYPDKHCDAPNMAYDLQNLKTKVDKGAHYVVTQMVFSVESYFSFVEQARQMGITVPIVPGLKMLTSKKQLTVLPRRFSVEIPHDLTKEIIAHDDKATKQIGLEWTIAMCRDLLAQGVPSLHFYSMNNGHHIRDIVKQLV
ncbi:methylenetetrahydrofolate reductase [Candidatus Woesearchaeota archaeon]|nr:methylenetetrahydrofolate reductase [Candidatus Woesearchaeota archaeon]